MSMPGEQLESVKAILCFRGRKFWGIFPFFDLLKKMIVITPRTYCDECP